MFDCGSNIAIALSKDDYFQDILYITRSLIQFFDLQEIHAISFTLTSEMKATYRLSIINSYHPLTLLINI